MLEQPYVDPFVELAAADLFEQMPGLLELGLGGDLDQIKDLVREVHVRHHVIDRLGHRLHHPVLAWHLEMRARLDQDLVDHCGDDLDSLVLVGPAVQRVAGAEHVVQGEDLLVAEADEPLVRAFGVLWQCLGRGKWPHKPPKAARKRSILISNVWSTEKAA